MNERPVRFGTERELIGVLTEPARAAATSQVAQASQTSSARVAFLLFNAGVLPRIGPHRMNVKLARALARAGQTSLRFDFSGQGDSRRAVTEADFRAQALRDLHCAMHHLEETKGIVHVALIGICSGAVIAMRAAVEDPRIVGVLMFDGHWYPAPWSATVRRWKRLRQAGWANVATLAWRRLRKPTAADRKAPTLVGGAEGMTGNPPRQEFVRSMQSLVDRGAAVYFVYSGSVIDAYSYAGQFRDAFGREPFYPKVRIDYRPDIDHTFLAIETQRRMIDLVERWVADVQQACAAAA